MPPYKASSYEGGDCVEFAFERISLFPGHHLISTSSGPLMATPPTPVVGHAIGRLVMHKCIQLTQDDWLELTKPGKRASSMLQGITFDAAHLLITQ
jgi:hypothetical protein